MLAAVTLVLVSSLALAAPDPTGGVYVRDSGIAVEKFALADRMERLGEWGKAADIYQEMLQQQADRVVASAADATRFRSVIAAVQDRLSHWSPDGLAIYRERFGPEAQSLLEQSEAEHRDDNTDDAAGLHKVFSRYFVTDAGKTAGLRLMDLALENADFSAAEWVGQRLLDQHPMLLDDRARVLYRTALAEHFGGNPAAASTRLTELRQKFPAALGTVRGADVVLADSLASELNRPITAPVVASGESWPMPFGSPDRARVPNATSIQGARLFSVPLDANSFRASGALAMAQSQRLSLKSTQARNRQLGLTIDVMPVVDRGELFFQDNAHIYAVSLEGGRPLPGWQETYPGEAAGRYSIPAWPTPKSQMTALCVTDESVLAVMGLSDADVANATLRPGHGSHLVCLDRRSGRERWTSDPDHFPADPPALRQLSLVGSPLVIGDNVYVLGTGGQGNQFQDCYVVCLDTASGTYRWSSYIASANDTAAIYEMEGAAGLNSNTPHLSYSAGRLFVESNIGAIASLDASDGSIAWLDLYARDSESVRLPVQRLWGGRPGNSVDPQNRKPWTGNPIIVREGKIYAIPSDSSSLLIYDAGNGALLQKIGLSYKTSLDGSGPSETADTLIGIAADPAGKAGLSAVIASDRSVFCVQLDGYDPARGIDNLRWLKTWTQPRSGPEDSIRGRPFLTRDSVIVPLAWSLVSVSLRNGSQEATFPATGTWGEHDVPGNVLLTADHLIIAGAQQVNVYTDLSVATARLDREIAAKPDDPEPRLRYAEVLFAAQQLNGPSGALTKLDEAAALMGLTRATTEPAANAVAFSGFRAQLFNDALYFAMKADDSVDQLPDRKIIDAIFDRAGRAAATPAEQVTYRLRRAEHLRRANDPAAELTLYQQILLDPRLRSVTVTSADKGIGPAGGFVRQYIVDLLQHAGAGMYRPYEEAAAGSLAAAQSNQNAAERREQYLSIGESYPNSKSARDALLLAAREDEASGNPRGAAAVLRDFFSRYPDSSQRAAVLESLARLYLQMPNRVDHLSVAIGRLEQGSKLPDSPRLQQPLKLPDGAILQNVTFRQAADALRQFQTQAETSALPDPHIAPQVRGVNYMPEDPTATIADVTAIIAPLEESSRHDRIVTFNATRGLSVYPAGSNHPLFTATSVSEQPQRIAWIGGNLLVWCPSRLMMVCGEDGGQSGTTAGTIIWDSGLQNLPTAQVASIGATAADAAANATDTPNEKPDEPGLVLNGPNGVIIRGRGVIINRGIRLQIINGRAVPIVANAAPKPTASEQIEHLVVGADRIVFSTSSTVGVADADAPATGNRIVSVSLSDGHVLWQTRLTDRSIAQIIANDDFVAVRAVAEGDVRLIAFDAQSGQPVWRPKPFSRDNDDVATPVNMALAQDGSLVYVMADRLCCKDLFDPDQKLRFEHPVPHGGTTSTFLHCEAADQLLVRDGRIVVVTDAGMFVRIYSLLDGQPASREGNGETLLSTGIVSPWNAHLRLVGDRLYIFGPDRVVHYGLNIPKDHWSILTPSSPGPNQTSLVIRDMIVTPTQSLLLLTPMSPQLMQVNAAANGVFAVAADPPAAVPAMATRMRIRAVSRALLPDGRETGMENGDRLISEPSGVGDVQVVDGGVYYITGDHTLHYLRGK